MKQRTIWQICSILGVTLLVAPPAAARSAASMCGTERGNWREQIALHRKSERTRRAQALLLSAARPALAVDSGDIAVMNDSQGVVAYRNRFDLQGLSVTFTPVPDGAPGYRFATTVAAYDETAAASGALLKGLGDDDARAVGLPFSFPFYGTGRAAMFVHSDGNLSFELPDASSSNRSLGRLASGPPRIAPLFSDLDPTQAAAEIRVDASTARVVVSWREVPQYSDTGVGQRQSFQAALYPDGRITFSYKTVASGDMVVGISPGGLQGSPEVVSFAGDESGLYRSTVAESFARSNSLDMVRVAQRFYETHSDAYDYLVVFNALGVAASPGAVAYETTVRSHRLGIGDTPVDIAATYGSPRRLQAVLNMGPLEQYPLDPYALVPARGSTGDTPLSVISHETGHLFLALASVRDPNYPSLRPMLGTQLAHWSFNFNSEASFLEGNRIADTGAAGALRFLTTGTVEQYAPLDQYLMGLRTASEVPPTFLVRNSPVPATAFPSVGVSFGGTRQDVTIDDLIAAEGVRVPDSTVEQRHYRFAFILLANASGAGLSADVAQLETYRSQFSAYYAKATGERASADCRLKNALDVSLWPASGVLVGASASATIRLDQPATADLTVGLTRNAGLLEAPDSVIIPAGWNSARFEVRGLSTGVAELTAVASGGAHEDVSVRIPVRDSAAGLKLDPFYFDGYSLGLTVRDANRVPYSNIRLLVSTAGASVTEVRTDDNGVAWIPSDPSWQLVVEIDGAPDSKRVFSGYSY